MDLGMSGIKRNAHKKRFSDEQIKFLEVIFESETRPESRIKHQLANELGLQPRQVSIWFQNRRARLKTKQIEREYNLLKTSYDALASKFESLKRENQSLLIQLQKLRNLQVEHQGSRNYKSERADRSAQSKLKERPCLEMEGCEHIEDMPANDHNRRTIERSKEENDVWNLTAGTDGSMASLDWHSFESNCIIDGASYTLQGWEFLS